jgi:3-phenylpropionate/trans-cinnamate dioxygenase ferredoxin reductase subunit
MSMTNNQTFVIVGASLAGAKAAETLRESGFEGRVVLVGAEPEPPYERPPLSKEYLRGEVGRDKLWVHDDQRFYERTGIELRTGVEVIGLDVSSAAVELTGGERIPYEKLLLATGAEPRMLRIPGSELGGIYYLRTVDDSDRLRERIEQGGKLVVVGAGWIGAEAAASAREKGCEVALLEQTAVPLERVLGPELGTVYRDIHADHGVQFVGDTRVERFEGSDRVERVVTAAGEALDCDFVVVGVGVAPRTRLAEQADGLEVDNGVLVDELLRTSNDRIYAAGDVANAYHPLLRRRVRVEHWANALNQGPAAARAMLGKGEPYEQVPYFFSDQYDVGMEYCGFATEWDKVVFRGDPVSREFIAFWIKDNRVLAGMNVNVWDVNEQIQGLIRSGKEVDEAALRDPDVQLSSLTAEPAGR